MYQALYRKWRPRVFEDVYGQPNITATLKNEIIHGRIGHAYIFTGSRGTGKTTCAKILAKAVNCLNPKDGDPCNECENCKGIDNGTLLDVVEIDAASNNGVDNIRDLREETAYTPAGAKYRVYIIDEAHMLSTGAFNALLKTLEEPPAYVIFILATTEVHKIPATILSRCQRFDFQRIPQADIIARLNYVAKEEKIELSEDAAAMIARLSDGAMRNALSLLDQCATGGTVDEEKVEAAAGLTDRKYLFDLSKAVINSDAALALKIIDDLYSMSKNVEKLTEELISHFRDIMVVKTVKNPFDIVMCRKDERDMLTATATEFSLETVLYCIDTLEETLETLKRSASGRVTIETCLLRLCNPQLDTSKEALLRRIEILEKKLAGGVVVQAQSAVQQPLYQPVQAPVQQPVSKTVETATNATVNTQQTPVQTLNTAPQKQAETADQQTQTKPTFNPEDNGPLSCWAEIIEAVKHDDAPLFGVISNTNATVRDGFVLVDSDNPLFVDMIKQKEHQRALIKAIRTITGKPYKVGITKNTLETPKESEPDDPLNDIIDNAKNLGINLKEN